MQKKIKMEAVNSREFNRIEIEMDWFGLDWIEMDVNQSN